jgi:hypothetical protein
MKISQITVLIITLFFSQASFTQQRSSSIRSIDFANFKYPGSRGLFPTVEYETESFILHKGKAKETPKQYGMTLVEISYGDVTGDGIEEAMINLNVETDGSAGVNHVYIYRLEGGKPKFLWGFESGDRAWGGLKQVYADGGYLVVELYGRGTQVEGNLNSSESVGLCCPRSFTRTRYQWRGNRFRQYGEFEILPVPERSGSR